VTDDARTLAALRLLARNPGAREVCENAGLLVELEGRQLIQEPGFEGIWEITPYAARVLDGSAELDQTVPRNIRWQNLTSYKGAPALVWGA
jgi:hypothetical protein